MCEPLTSTKTSPLRAAALGPEEKVQDLCAFAVSDEHHALRESLGVAVQP